MLYRPATRREAACYKGTRLSFYWDEATQGWPTKFYPATVVKVPEEPVEGDEEGIYFKLEFLDQPKGFEEAWQDVEWEEFEDPATCRIAWLPLKAREHQLNQRKLAREKGKQVTNSSREDPHAHLLTSDAFGTPPAGKRQKVEQPESQLASQKSSKAAAKKAAMACASPLKVERSRLADAASKHSQQPKQSNQRKNKKRKQPGGEKPLPNGSASVSFRDLDPEEGPSTRIQPDPNAWNLPEPSGSSDLEASADGNPEETGAEQEPAVTFRPSKQQKASVLRPAIEEEEEEEEPQPAMQGIDLDSHAPQHAAKRLKTSHQTQQQGLTNTGEFKSVAVGPGDGHAGQIKRLELENFMCHEHIKVDFIPRMNFMCGQNGSGKTAVLHGLQTCLGVSAKQSGRVTTGSDFIRDGASYCKCSTTLWNAGGDAYLPKRLGSEVTIVREMRRVRDKTSVVSSWAILDARGRKVATRRSDVDELLRSLNVSAGNPIVCLTQDTARSFGGSKASQERYRIFMEATQFDVIIEHLKLAENELQEMKSRKRDLQKVLKERDDLLQAVLKKLENMEEIRVWEEQQLHLQNWIAWEHVLDPRRKAAECEEKLQGQATSRMEENAAQITEAEGNLETLRETHEAQKAAIDDFPQRLAALQEEHRAQQGLYQQAKKEAQRLRSDLRKAEKELQEKQDMSETLEETIAEMRAHLKEASEKEEQATAAALRQKIAEALGADADAVQARQEIREAQAVLREATGGVQAAEQSRAAANRRMMDVQSSLQRLRSQQEGNTVQMFAMRGQESKMEAFVRKIDQAVQSGRFHKPPLGPIGSLLTLTDDKWAVAVEASVGRAFNNFIVHNHHDCKLLKELAQSVSRFSVPAMTIYDFSHKAYDLSRSRQAQVPEALMTVLRVLKVKEGEHAHIIRNVLVDTCSAERLLLVENESEGMRAIRSHLSRDQIITSAWDRTGWHGYKRGRNETSFPLAQGRRIHARLRKDVASALAETQSELQQMQDSLAIEADRIRAAKAEEQRCKRSLKEAQEASQQKQLHRSQLESQIMELRTQHESQTQHNEASVDDLGLQLADVLREITSLQNLVQERKGEVTAAEEKEGRKHQSMKDKKKEIDDQLELNSRELAVQMQCLEKVQEAEGKLEQLKEFRRRLKEAVAKLETSKADFLASSERAREMAVQRCSEDEFRVSQQQLEAAFRTQAEAARRGRSAGEEPLSDLDLMARWLEDLERKIAVREQQVGATRAELETERAEHEKWVKTRKDELMTLNHAYALFMQSYQDRRGRARKMRKDTLHAIENSFNANLHQRGYTGGLEIDWEDHTLDYKVKVDSSANQAVSDVKSLSGGERSFINLCFIMAIGKDISSPFHCMDEFDVFMDAFNRRKSIEMLMRFGATHMHLQIVLLTPQSTHMIEDALQFLKKSMKEEFPEGNFVLTRAMGDPRPQMTHQGPRAGNPRGISL